MLLTSAFKAKSVGIYLDEQYCVLVQLTANKQQIEVNYWLQPVMKQSYIVDINNTLFKTRLWNKVPDIAININDSQIDRFDLNVIQQLKPKELRALILLKAAQRSQLAHDDLIVDHRQLAINHYRVYVASRTHIKQRIHKVASKKIRWCAVTPDNVALEMFETAMQNNQNFNFRQPVPGDVPQQIIHIATGVALSIFKQ